LELENRSFNVAECIEEVLDLFAGKISATGIDLIYEIAPGTPENVIGDSLRLRQVLVNLIGNAIKFTSKGEVFLGVECSARKGEQTELLFQIRDTGIGIPEEKLNSLFQAFTQVDSSTTRKYGGTGLGLVISKRLVELMGGIIHADSKPAKGTTFYFTIKVEESSEAAVTMPVSAEIMQHKKVLVVDDNATNRMILRKQLEFWKIAAIAVESGEEALGVLSTQHDFDLVITDMHMPQMDGVQLAQRIKKVHKHLPIILLSSVGDEKNKLYKDVFASTVMKPVRRSDLQKVIIQSLSNNVPSSNEKELPEQKLSTNFASSHPLKILIAEDNAVNQTLIMMVMKKLGYQPDLTTNGVEALRAVQQKNYDLILMDVQMPEMDGLEASKFIRKLNIPQPIIIALTANAMQDDRNICIAAGMDDYISKPLAIDKLMLVLENW
jgi:CheY-like chemotaxis protein